MRALITALIYFGSFLAIGLIAKLAISRWMVRRNLDLFDIQAQAGPPLLGEHCTQVFGDWLGMSAGDVDALRKEGWPDLTVAPAKAGPRATAPALGAPGFPLSRERRKAR